MGSFIYQDVHDKMMGWLEEGLIKFEGKASKTEYTDFDLFILEFFNKAPSDLPSKDTPDDYRMYYIHIRSAVSQLNSDFFNGLIDIDWLFKPHAYTIFKIKLARKENGTRKTGT